MAAREDHHQAEITAHTDHTLAHTPLTEKPPPGPMKRKKKLDRSLVDLSCNAKLEEKRQKISDDKSSTAAKKRTAPKPEVMPASAPVPPRSSSASNSNKAKELQNHTLFKLRRKNEETNAALVQKLNAYTEQLRLEVNGLKTALVSEKNAVRALRWVIPDFFLPNIKLTYSDSRAQQEAVARKLKLEAKQGHQGKGAVKKQCVEHIPTAVEAEQKNGQASTSKLVNQIAVLKDQNKSLEGKVQVRRKRR